MYSVFIWGTIFKGFAQLTGKTFVHRGQVLAAPQKPVPKGLTIMEEMALSRQMETSLQDVHEKIKVKFAEQNKEIVAQIERSSNKLTLKYDSGKVLSKLVTDRKINNNENARSELIKTLVDCGLSKEAAFTKAMDKYPLGT